MKVFFDLSLEEKWHRLEWERRLAEAMTGNNKNCEIVNSRSASDVVFVTKEPNASLKPLSRVDVNTLIWSDSDRPVGRYSGFYCSLPKKIFDARRHKTFCYPLVHNEQIEKFSTEEASADLGFMGGITAPIRRKIVGVLAGARSLSVDLKVQGGPWTALFDRSGVPSKIEYAEHLRRTKFVICPRGNGVGSVRLFEVMQAGRVPVIISDQYVLPSGISWDDFSIRIKENEIWDLERIVMAYMDKWPEFAARSRAAWENNFCIQVLPSQIGSLLEQFEGRVPYQPVRFLARQLPSTLNSGLKKVARVVLR